MNGDLVLKIILSFLIPFIMLFGFVIIVSYKTFGLYSFALSLLYFIIVYILSVLRYKSINSNNALIIRIFGKILITLFLIFLLFVLFILTNIKIPHLYEYIKF